MTCSQATHQYSFFFKIKRIHQGIFSACITLLLLIPAALQGQDESYDLLLKGGHVIDPKNEVDGVMDIAIMDGRIASVGSQISAERAKNIAGYYITPGLIDIHAHHFHGTKPNQYLSNSFTALPPDGFTFRAGVTTAVDVGGSGWKNFDLFKEQVIERSQTRILAFINIVGSGMREVVPFEQNLDDMNPKMTAMVANQNPEIAGIKIAHYIGHEWEPYFRAVEAAELTDLPVMVDFGEAEPVLELNYLFQNVLRSGDIYTHTYFGSITGEVGRQSVIDENGILRPGISEAREKGIIFDVGFGGGSFFFDIAVPATNQNFWPHTISTDLHTGSMNGGMKNMLNVVSIFLNLGMNLQEVIKASTWTPAQVILREDLGHLSVGAEADVAVLICMRAILDFRIPAN